MFKLAELFVDIRADQAPFDRALSGVRGQLSTTNVAVGSFVGNIAASVARAAVSLGAGLFTNTIKSASDMGETMDKVKVIMGESAGIIVKEAERMSAAFGVSKNEYINAAASFGAVFKGVGKSQEEAAGLGNQLAKLGLDMASLDNTAPTEAFTALQAALRGEFDPLERYRVFLSAAAVSQEAMRMGLIGSSKEMTEQAKKAATLSLIMKGSSDAQNNLEITSGSTANQMRRFQGMVENLSVSIGQTLMPAFNELVKQGNALVGALSLEGNQAAIASWVEWVRGGIATAGVIITQFGSFWQIATLTAQEYIYNFMAVIESVGVNIVNIAGWIGTNWSNLLIDAIMLASNAFANFASNVGNLLAAAFNALQTGKFEFDWIPLTEGFVATTSKLPELIQPAFVSMQGEIDKITEDMSNKAVAAAGGTAALKAAAVIKKAAAAPEELAAKAAKAEAPKLVDTASFATDLISAQFGNSDAKKQLEAAEKTAKNTAEMNEKIGKMAMVASFA